MDHDYEYEDDYAPRVLWGRVAFFLLALVLAFVTGRACAPDGIDPTVHQAVNAQASELASKNAVLEQQLDARDNDNQGNAGNGGEDSQDGGDPAATEEPTEEAGQDPIGEGEEYTVQEGDTLFGLAERFYGNTDDATLIEDANNLDRDTDLIVGQVLVIPPKD